MVVGSSIVKVNRTPSDGLFKLEWELGKKIGYLWWWWRSQANRSSTFQSSFESWLGVVIRNKNNAPYHPQQERFNESHPRWLLFTSTITGSCIKTSVTCSPIVYIKIMRIIKCIMIVFEPSGQNWSIPPWVKTSYILARLLISFWFRTIVISPPWIQWAPIVLGISR